MRRRQLLWEVGECRLRGIDPAVSDWMQVVIDAYEMALTFNEALTLVRTVEAAVAQRVRATLESVVTRYPQLRRPRTTRRDCGVEPRAGAAARARHHHD